MIITENNHKRVLYKHCLKARTAHARGHVILSKNNASQMRCSCLVLLNFHTMSSDTLKTKTGSLLRLNQDRRFLLPTKVYDHKCMQKLHLTQKVKICSYVVLSYEGSVVVRHNKTQETPLPLYIGFSVHAATSKKSLIDQVFDVGVCVSYDRLMSILSDLASGVCQRFEEEQAVCPLNFKGNLFTTAAVDNIDHNPSSTSAQGSFHGTGISLQQHPDVDTPGNDRNIAFLKDVTQTKSYSNLPVAYTSVSPIRLVTDKPSVSSFTGHFTQTGMYLTDAVKADNAWLDDIWQKWQKCSFDSDSVVSWSVYNAQNQAPVQHALSLCGMLPLFHENAHNVSMIRHSMDVVKAAVSKLNPGQVPVITFDQPPYALAKLIQWNWPESYGVSKFVIMLGGLHTEMAALKALGSFLGGSGWVEAVTEAGLVTPGSAEALLSASHVRRCRRVHEVTLAALHILQCR